MPSVARASRPPLIRARDYVARPPGPRLLSRGPRRRCPGLARTGHLEQASSIGPARTNRLSLSGADQTGSLGPAWTKPGGWSSPSWTTPVHLVQHRLDQAAQLVRGGWTNPLDQRRPGLARNGCPWTRHASTGQTPGQATIEALVPSAYVTGPTSRTSHDPSWSKPVRDPGPARAAGPTGLDQTPGPKAPWSNAWSTSATVHGVGPSTAGPGTWSSRPRTSGPAARSKSVRGPNRRAVVQRAVRFLGPSTGPRPAARRPARPGDTSRRQTVVGPMPRPSVARGPSRRPLCRSTRSTVPAREPRPRCGRAEHHDVDRTAGSGAQCNAACAHLRAPLAPPSLGARG